MPVLRWGAVIAVASLALAGCGAVNAGSAVEEEFNEAIRGEHGDLIVETRVNAHNDLPFAGGASATVVVRPEASAEEFAAVLEDVLSFGPSTGDYDGVGVIANGVGVCAPDPQREAKQALRDALHEGGVSLAGEWACPPASGDDPRPYVGTLAQFDADLGVVASVGGAPGLHLEAWLSEPSGKISGPLDELPDTLGESVDAVADLEDIVDFEVVEGSLNIAITPTSDPAAAQAAAEAVAGPDLSVEVVLGSLDPAQQTEYAALGPLLDDLREVPGVVEVETSTHVVTLRTMDPEQVVAIQEAALAHEEFENRLTLEILVGEGTQATGAAEYTRPLGGERDGIALFHDLVTHPGVSHARVQEPSPTVEAWITVDVVGPLTDVADLRSLLPVGVEVQASSDQDNRSVRFTIADTVSADDFYSVHDDTDVAGLVAAWNAAG